MESAIEAKHFHDGHVQFEASEGEIKINEPPKPAGNWRHGDLKLDNILSYGEEENSSW
jgi:hypothetical protein